MSIFGNVGNDWDGFLESEFAKPYFLAITGTLTVEYRKNTVFPPLSDVFNAFKYCPLSNVKAVIVGQDPYIHSGEAHGLAFSVLPGVAIPPSLRNIFMELKEDLGITPPKTGCLTKWAENGVLLLNTVLTVAAGQPKSHAYMGWQTFTDAAISAVNQKNSPVVFMLWGNDAKKKSTLVTNNIHKILSAAHPSPLAGGKFNGCRHFSQANAFLEENGVSPINWSL